MPLLLQNLSDTPVVLVHGPRQCGKTTLTKMVEESHGYKFLSFDDVGQLQAATEDPVGYVSKLPEKTILDEVQKVPELFSSIKMSVDNNRKPGRFILAGSANVLLLPKLSDSLAGRMGILRLHPLAQAELNGAKTGFLEDLFTTGPGATTQAPRVEGELAQRVAAGGYPEALARKEAMASRRWHLNYVTTMIQRDAKELRQITTADALPSLLTLAARHTAQLSNISNLAKTFQISRPTINSYIALLEQVFMLERLPAWHNNASKRLVKTPKLHMGDSGLACSLLGLDVNALLDDRATFGQMLETFVYQELRKLASWQQEPVNFSHFRDKDGVEVDIVLESRNRVAGIEVKAGATVTAKDLRGLKKLREAAGEKFTAGVILYDGDATLPFGPKLFAAPVSSLWSP